MKRTASAEAEKNTDTRLPKKARAGPADTPGVRSDSDDETFLETDSEPESQIDDANLGKAPKLSTRLWLERCARKRRCPLNRCLLAIVTNSTDSQQPAAEK